MKTSEFKKKIAALGMTIEEHDSINPGSAQGECHSMCLVTQGGLAPVASVETKRTFGIDTKWRLFEDLSDNLQKDIYKLLVEYAATPIAEREDEPKKYAIRLLSGDTGYLNYNKDTSLCLDTAGIESNWGPYECFFTEQEYNRIRKNELQAGFTFLPKFDPDNTDVFVPVEDEDEDE